MIPNVFSKVGELLNERFVFNALLPATLLGLGLLVVWETSGEGLPVGAKRLADLDGTTKAAVSGLTFAAVFLAATLLSSQSPRLLRWMSGTGGPFKWSYLSDAGTTLWRAEQAALRVDEVTFSVPRRGEAQDDVPQVAPTALGTLSYATAYYAEVTYGIKLAAVWPRLRVKLPIELTTPVEDAEKAVEQLVAFSTAAAVFGLVAAPVAAYHRASLVLSVLLPVAAYVLAFVLYRAVLPAAEQWSRLVRTACDLHRFELLDELNVPRPRTSVEERITWRRVSDVLFGQNQLQQGYPDKEPGS